jgi:hypothetical protein
LELQPADRRKNPISEATKGEERMPPPSSQLAPILRPAWVG